MGIKVNNIDKFNQINVLLMIPHNRISIKVVQEAA